jgi:uncharacterized protein
MDKGMSKGWISGLFGAEVEEPTPGAASESQLRLPTLDERVKLYVRALGEQQSIQSEWYSDARDRLLDAMAADIAIKAGITLPEEPERHGLPDADPSEALVRRDFFVEQQRRSEDRPLLALRSQSYPADHASVAACAKSYTDRFGYEDEVAVAQTAGLRRRPALRLAMLTASIFAVAVIGGSVTMSLLKEPGSSTESLGAISKSGKLDVAGQSSQKPSNALAQTTARNEQVRTQPMASASAPQPPRLAGLDAPSLTNQLTPEEIADLFKLGRMYADGDGVPRDDVRAFNYFTQIASTHPDEAPGTQQARFVANAFVSLGHYYLTGIPNSKITADPARARDMFGYAATYFGDADAQFELGQLYLSGAPADAHQAARWFQLAATKGHCRAEVALGEMLFQGQVVPRQAARGLMWLTLGRDCAGSDESWVKPLYDSAFKRASEDERAQALVYLEDWLKGRRE